MLTTSRPWCGVCAFVVVSQLVLWACNRRDGDGTPVDAGSTSGDSQVLGDVGLADGGSDCGCSPLEECFDGRICVARSVEIGGYRIDATEVTRDQYADWLALAPDPGAQDARCVSWNVSFTPDNAWPERGCEADAWPPGSNGNHPVVCVDWCDAYAYCASVGKRLCGRIGGGANDYADHDDPTQSQWYNACSSGGAHNYPYGGDPSVDFTDGFDDHACNGIENLIETTVPVASMTGCQSTEPGYTGVFDLSGNVREWEDSCAADAGDAACHLRGGSFGDAYHGPLRCADGFYNYRTNYFGDLGFRCCSP